MQTPGRAGSWRVKGQHGQDPEEGAGIAPEDKGVQGGQRRAGLGGSENFIPRALGSHRGWCTGERAVQQGREVGQEPGEQWAPEPRAGSSPTQSPAGKPGRNLGRDFPPSQKKSGPWVPRVGVSVERSGLPHPAAAESEARGGGGGDPNHTPFQQRRQAAEHAGAQLPPPPGQTGAQTASSRALPAPAPPRRDVSHSILTCQHWKGPTWGRGHGGLGQDRVGSSTLGQIPSWGTEQGPSEGRDVGRRPGDCFKVGWHWKQAAGTKNWSRGRAGPPGRGNSTREGSEVGTQTARPSRDLSGLCSASGAPEGEDCQVCGES